MKKLVLVRGLPGSGKSTKAKSLGGKHIEADTYFIRDGVYQFNDREIASAHSWCQYECADAMEACTPLIVVSNTFTQEWEMRSYLDMACENGYQVEIKDLFDAGLTDEELAARCVHSVPVQSIARMRARWE